MEKVQKKKKRDKEVWLVLEYVNLSLLLSSTSIFLHLEFVGFYFIAIYSSHYLNKGMEYIKEQH